MTATFSASSPLALWLRSRSARLTRRARSRPAVNGLERYTMASVAVGAPPGDGEPILPTT